METSLSSSSSSSDEALESDSFEVPIVFTEMLELIQYKDGYTEWKEIARWIKYEEDVEIEGNRWSKPHVSTPHLISWFQLKSFLTSGLVLLDIEANDFEDIIGTLVEKCLERELTTIEDSIKLQDIWKKKHRHQFEGQRKPEGKLSTVIKDLLVKKLERNTDSSCNDINLSSLDETSKKKENRKKIENGKINMALQKKISKNTEACIILEGNLPWLSKPLSIFLKLKRPLILEDLPEVDIPTRLIYIILCPTIVDDAEVTIVPSDIGISLATALTDKAFATDIYNADTLDDLMEAFHMYSQELKILPREWNSENKIDPPKSRQNEKYLNMFDEIDEDRRMREASGLVRSGKLFGGLINDIKRKLPFYISDFTEGFHPQCISSFLFLYFACLAPIVAFGGLLGKATDNRIATIESLVSGLLCGVLFGLFSGQPLVLLGSTGPVYVFEKILYSICIDQGWDYLSLRLWIGIWVGAILIFLVAVDASAYVCYITRFTEELFATLIAFIFVFNAFMNLEKIRHVQEMSFPSENVSCECSIYNVSTLYNMTPSECFQNKGILRGECDIDPHVFLMSCLLFIGSFIISFFLKNFKTTNYLPSNLRNTLSDFSVVIAILLMTLVDYFSGFPTPKLEVPSSFKPTWEGRDWIVTHALIFTDHILTNPWWVDMFLAPIFAILATILIFMDQQITAVIVNRKENQLMKGGGYHLDLMILALTIIICSVFGLPWFVAATVLSINHIQSLTKESTCSVPGDKPKFLGIREQRITHILIALCIGLSTMMTQVLAVIPMPVLFGIFLYMGVNSLKGLQFFDRLLLFFIPRKYQPDYVYLKFVTLTRIHIFTLIQLFSLITLWIVKNEPSTSIAFPVMLVFICGIRKLLEYFFTRKELRVLDDLLPEADNRRIGGLKKKRTKKPTRPETVKTSKKLQLKPIYIEFDENHKTKKNFERNKKKQKESSCVLLHENSSIPVEDNKKLIFMRMKNSEIFMPVHIINNQLKDLLKAISLLFSLRNVNQVYIRNTKNMIFYLSNDLLEAIKPKDIFEIEIMSEELGKVDLIFNEINISSYL